MSGNYSVDSAATPRVSVLSEGHEIGDDVVGEGEYALLLGDPDNAAFALIGTLEEIRNYVEVMALHVREVT